MNTKFKLISVLTILVFSGILFANLSKWHLLGSREVKFRTEKDVIAVGAEEGLFTKIKLTVNKSAVHFNDMKVHFANGKVFDVKLRTVIPAGGETRVIDLPGDARNIKKVVFWYYSTLKNPKRAVVKLYGKR
ncbi:hypothetical protein BMS3Abin03_00902 [bacterium BMS3Abin03]|nr:hypothetical protein BMS3Abin03_00902 [bacterium BMS3Abin03]